MNWGCHCCCPTCTYWDFFKSTPGFRIYLQVDSAHPLARLQALLLCAFSRPGPSTRRSRLIDATAASPYNSPHRSSQHTHSGGLEVRQRANQRRWLLPRLRCSMKPRSLSRLHVLQEAASAEVRASKTRDSIPLPSSPFVDGDSDADLNDQGFWPRAVSAEHPHPSR